MKGAISRSQASKIILLKLVAYEFWLNRQLDDTLASNEDAYLFMLYTLTRRRTYLLSATLSHDIYQPA